MLNAWYLICWQYLTKCCLWFTSIRTTLFYSSFFLDTYKKVFLIFKLGRMSGPTFKKNLWLILICWKMQQGEPGFFLCFWCRWLDSARRPALIMPIWMWLLILPTSMLVIWWWCATSTPRHSLATTAAKSKPPLMWKPATKTRPMLLFTPWRKMVTKLPSPMVMVLDHELQIVYGVLISPTLGANLLLLSQWKV